MNGRPLARISFLGPRLFLPQGLTQDNLPRIEGIFQAEN